jgi:hypothetical protein
MRTSHACPTFLLHKFFLSEPAHSRPNTAARTHSFCCTCAPHGVAHARSYTAARTHSHAAARARSRAVAIARRSQVVVTPEKTRTNVTPSAHSTALQCRWRCTRRLLRRVCLSGCGPRSPTSSLACAYLNLITPYVLGRCELLRLLRSPPPHTHTQRVKLRSYTRMFTRSKFPSFSLSVSLNRDIIKIPRKQRTKFFEAALSMRKKKSDAAAEVAWSYCVGCERCPV